MTTEAQRIAIAEACGWRKVYTGPMSDGQVDDRYIVGIFYRSIKDMPNYLNDLNAMHEAEEFLCPEGYECDYDKDKSQVYKDRLVEITRRDRALVSAGVAHRATAAQRAEAFLKARGLWKEAV